MPRGDIKNCKALLHERRLAKRGRREPNNQKDDGENKPCAFYASFCGEKNKIYGRKQGAKDKRPRRPRRPAGGAKGGLPVTELRDRIAQARAQAEREMMGVEDARDTAINTIESMRERARDSLVNRVGRVGKGGMLLPSGKEVGDLSPAFSREVPSLQGRFNPPAPSMFSVGTQQAWVYPPARAYPAPFGYFAM